MWYIKINPRKTIKFQQIIAKYGERLMLAEERFGIILELLEKQQTVSISQLCEKLGISEATARRDLTALDRQGRLTKVHGGAIALRETVQSGSDEPDFVTKSKLHIDEKERIARYAAAQVNDDDFVFLDAGTTVIRMVEHLTKSRAAFVTTGITCARRLVEMGLRAYVVGGLLKPGTEAIVGGVALEGLQGYHFTKAFLGANGVTVKEGVTTPDTEEARIKAKAVEQAYMTYVLADSSKFGKAAAVTICPMNKVCIITSRLPDEAYRQHAVIKEVEAGSKSEKTSRPAKPNL